MSIGGFFAIIFETTFAVMKIWLLSSPMAFSRFLFMV
nr:MAG TPA: hypothetical protein [Caudoviricetes sp.]